jgi:hypothetical protein
MTVTEELPQNTVCLSVARDAGRLRNVRPYILNCGCCSNLCLHIDGVFFSSMIGLWSAVKEGYEDGCSVFNDCVVVVSFAGPRPSLLNRRCEGGR